MEISILKNIDHINVIHLHDIIHDKNRIYAVLEYADTDLFNFIHSIDGKINVKMIKKLIFQILKGVEELHENNVLHRDIKTQNILIKDYRVVKLADFGLAREEGVPSNYTDEVATLWYRPLDVLMGNTKYSKSIDIWSVGCVMAELFCDEKKPLFMGKNWKDQIRKIFKVLGTPNLNDNPELARYPNYRKAIDNLREYRPKKFSKLFNR